MMAAATFRIKRVDEHPMQQWLTFMLPEEVARKIYKDYYFSQVSHSLSSIYSLLTSIFDLGPLTN